MAEYIDREKLCKNLIVLAKFQEPYKQSTILGVVETIVNTRSADVVEVVRCKDCKWWTPMDRGYSWHNEGRTDGECQILYSNHYAERALTEREHFCSYGERKEQK